MYLDGQTGTENAIASRCCRLWEPEAYKTELMSSGTLVGETPIITLLSTATSVDSCPPTYGKAYISCCVLGVRKGGSRSVTWPGAGTH